MPTLDLNKFKIGHIILVVIPKPVIRKLQQKAGYGDSSRWSHVAGCLGGYDIEEVGNIWLA